MRKINIYYFLFYCLYHGKHAFKAKFETEEDVLRSVNYMLIIYITSFIFFSLFNLNWILVLGDIDGNALYVMLGVIIAIISALIYFINRKIFFQDEKYRLVLAEYDRLGISKTTCKTVAVLFPIISIVYMTLSGILFNCKL